jgi:hypothetical protein
MTKAPNLSEKVRRYDPESVLDHFKIWKVKRKEFSRDVTLKGQFDSKTMPAALETVEWLANPVSKNDGKILNEKAHLVGYFLKQPSEQPARWVVIKNQFHLKPIHWRLTDPAVLLVPASKVHSGEPPKPPADLDHFECYIVAGGEAAGQHFILEDQFDLKRGKSEKISKVEPAFFCVPVSKNGERIVNPAAHLALYDITPRTPYVTRVITRDQFGVLELEVEESLMVGVPTEKVEWGEGGAQPEGAGGGIAEA